MVYYTTMILEGCAVVVAGSIPQTTVCWLFRDCHLPEVDGLNGETAVNPPKRSC